MAQGLAEKGHEITVLYADRFGHSTSIPKDPNIKFIPVRFRLPKIFQTPVVGRIINYLGLTELIRFQEDSKLISRSINFLQLEKPFDVIESPSNGATLYRYLTSINSSNCMIRIATTDKKHSSINSTTTSSYLKRTLEEESKTLNQCPNLVTHTYAHRDNICREYNLPTQKFSIIPLSVKIPLAEEILPTFNKRKTVVLFVGRFEKRKGIDLMFEIIPRVLLVNEDVEFRLVGEDLNKDHQIAFQSKHPQIQDKVCFMGKISTKELENEYRNCNVFIAPSRYESFGLIYAEAMSYAKPVIGTNVGGIPEVIGKDNSGILCENENVDSFVQALIKLTQDSEMSSRMGRSARKRAIQLFDRKTLISRTENYYSRTIKAHKTESD